MTNTNAPKKPSRITTREAITFCASYVDLQRSVDEGLLNYAAGWFECSIDEARERLREISIATGATTSSTPLPER